jgi:PKD repeat protein
MRSALWVIVGVSVAMCIAAGCTRSEEKPVPTATPALSPAAAATAPAAAEAEEDEEILMVWAEAEPEEGPPPLTVQLKADISGGKGDRKIKWDFGDGSPPSSDVNPTHTYQKAGSFRASVEVGDGTGDSDSDYVDVEVGTE